MIQLRSELSVVQVLDRVLKNIFKDSFVRTYFTGCFVAHNTI